MPLPSEVSLPSEAIPTDTVVLRPPRPGDTDDLLAAANDALVSRYVTALPAPFTSEDAQRWVTAGARSVIADPHTDRLLGAAGLHPVSEADGAARIGCWVAPWGRGQGVGAAALGALTGWANTHGFDRVELLTEPGNATGQRMAVRAGLTYEGVRRGAGRGRNGKRHDLVAWARLAGDPPGPSPRRLPDLPGGELTDGVVLIRPLVAGDTGDMFALMSLPESVRTTVPPVVPDPVGVRRRCEQSQGEWIAGERARMTIRDAATGTFAGNIGLHWTGPGMDELLVGYALARPYRGRGYATRATKLVARWALTEVGAPRLLSGTAPENVASQRVLERAGFQREGYERSRLPGADGGRIDNVSFGLLPRDLLD
ncbi:GNAT family N-acetyltransferase [Rugosimonospora acidiphila]